MSLYKVTGERSYRGYPPQTTFEASLNPAAERRAIERGAISRLEISTPSIQPGKFELPEGWHREQEVERSHV